MKDEEILRLERSFLHKLTFSESYKREKEEGERELKGLRIAKWGKGNINELGDSFRLVWYG